MPRATALRFTPYAWAKLLYLRDAGPTEIGGFGIAGRDNLLLIEDVLTVAQRATSVTVAFDDAAVADFFEQQVDQGRRPEQFGRIWLHTHPGDSPMPSGTDEETFSRVFASCDWAVMFILAKGGKTYCRLRFNVGPGGEDILPVEIDYSQEFAGSETVAWQAEYDQHVMEEQMAPSLGSGEEFFGMPARKRRNRDDVSNVEDDLQEALAMEYASYWGVEREVFE